MKYNPNKHHRRSIRLPGYDYSQAGAYFVTICADRRQCLFGDIVDGRMVLNQYGMVVAETYRWLCQRYPYLYTDEWIIMPNHFHAIMVIADKPRMDTDKPRRGVSRNAPTMRTAPTINERRTTNNSSNPTTKRKPLGTFNRCIQNRFHQKKLIFCAMHQEHRCGNVIITNILFVTKMRWIKSVSILLITPCLGT